MTFPNGFFLLKNRQFYGHYEFIRYVSNAPNIQFVSICSIPRR